MVSENNAKVIIKQGINIKLIALLMTIFIVWLIVLRPIFNIDLVHYENSNLGEKNVPFGEIHSSNALVQQIKTEGNIFVDLIELKLATYARTNTNKNTIKIFINKECVFQRDIPSKDLKDNSFYKIDNIKLNFNVDDEIYLVLESEDGTPGNAITAWTRTNIENGKLYKYNRKDGNYVLQDGEVIMKISEEVSTLRYISEKYLGISPMIATVLFIILSALIICLLYQFLNLKEEEGV